MPAANADAYGLRAMRVDARAAIVVALIVVAVIVLLAATSGRFGPNEGDSGGPGGACPPGHVTTTGCRAP
jgi:hypothetical protein